MRKKKKLAYLNLPVSLRLPKRSRLLKKKVSRVKRFSERITIKRNKGRGFVRRRKGQSQQYPRS